MARGIEKQIFAIGKYDATNETLLDAKKWDNLCGDTRFSDTTRDKEVIFNHAICTYFEKEKHTFLDTTQKPADFHLNYENLQKLTINHDQELITNKPNFLQDFVDFLEKKSGIPNLPNYL